MDKFDNHGWFDKIYKDTSKILALAMIRVIRKYPSLKDCYNEIIQDTYAELYRNCEKLKGHENICAWLVITLKNKAGDKLREKQKEYTRILGWMEIEEDAFFVEDISPEQIYIQRETERETRELISKMIGSKGLSILEAHYIEKVPIRILAAQMGISTGALKMQIHRWKKKFAKGR